MSLQSAIDAIAANPGSPSTRAQAASSGMIAAAEAAIRTTEFFEDTRAVLDELTLAKARLDAAAWHSPEVTKVTSAVLNRAQEFVSVEAIPCTEWPTPAEVVVAVRKAAAEMDAA